MAFALSRLSTCLRLQVGCVLLRADGSVAGVGYNGALPGQPHCDPKNCNPSSRCHNTRHAERSAMDYSTGDIAACYVTHEPCLRCAQDLIARGCKAVYYCCEYKILDDLEAGARAWHVYAAGVAWRQLGKLADNDSFHDVTEELLGIGPGCIGAPAMFMLDLYAALPVELSTPWGLICVDSRRRAGPDDQVSDVAVRDRNAMFGCDGTQSYLPASMGLALLRVATK